LVFADSVEAVQTLHQKHFGVLNGILYEGKVDGNGIITNESNESNEDNFIITFGEKFVISDEH
jgi:hypothetical protein